MRHEQTNQPRLSHAQPNRGLLGELPEQTMSARFLRVKCDPVRRCGINNIDRQGSTLDWRKALPIGNGDIGAAIMGYPDNYTLHIAKNDVWWDNVPLPDPYPPGLTLADLRRRVADGDVSVKHAIRHHGEQIRQAEPVPTTCARLTLQLCRSGTFYNVKEYANMAQSIASTEFSVYQNGVDGGPFWIQSIASRLEEVIAVRLRPPQEINNMGMVRFELGRDPAELSDLARQRGVSQAEFDRQYQPEAATDGAFGWFTMPLPGGDSYTVMAASDIRGLAYSTDGGDLRARGRPQDGPLTIYVTVVSSRDAADTVAEARRRLEHALAVGYGTISSEHSTWWNRYWNRSWVALPKGMSERSWYWGLYKAGSARRPGKVCPAYGAPWRKGNYLNWGSFTLGYEETKYNLGLLPTNHAELMEPWIAVVQRTAERMRSATAKFHELPGVAFPFGMSFTGEPVSCAGIYNSTPMSVATGGEAVKCCWDYYDFTGDLEFLSDVGYPLLKEVATFYRAYLLEDEQGRLVIFPSRYNEYDSWCEGLEDFMRNSVVDLTMFRLTLRRAAQAAEVLGVDADLAADWSDAADRLAPLSVWPDGTWKPSEDWFERGARQFMHPTLFETWPITVGDEIDAWHGGEEARKQARATYEQWLGGPQPLDTWDRCFPFLAAARMGDREYMAKILGHLETIPEAGNINRGDPPDIGAEDGHSPFAVDAGSAFPSEIITEMLLQSHAGEIRLFPATPLTGHFAFHSLRARGAFLVSSELRDGEVPYALIYSLRGNACRIAIPFAAGVAFRVRDLDTGATVPVETAANGEAIAFATEAGHLYVLEQTALPLEQVKEITI